MAMDGKARSAKAAQKRAALGEEELRLRAWPATRQALTSLMAWAEITEQGEALTLMIHHVHSLGRSGVTRLIGSRHKIEYGENVSLSVSGAMIRFGARSGTLTALNDLVEWTGARNQGAAMELVIHALHETGPDTALRFLTPPQHEYTVPAHVAAKLQLAYNREALRICRDE